MGTAVSAACTQKGSCGLEGRSIFGAWRFRCLPTVCRRSLPLLVVFIAFTLLCRVGCPPLTPPLGSILRTKELTTKPQYECDPATDHAQHGKKLTLTSRGTEPLALVSSLCVAAQFLLFHWDSSRCTLCVFRLMPPLVSIVQFCAFSLHCGSVPLRRCARVCVCVCTEY